MKVGMQRLLPPHLFLLCLIAMFLLHSWMPIAGAPRCSTLPLGIVLGISGMVCAVWGSRRFRRAQTNIHTFNTPQVLVRDGLFEFSRNPMYVGFALALVGTWIALGTLSPGIPVATFILVTDLWYIPFEERVMATTFGAEYEDYRKTTRRWL